MFLHTGGLPRQPLLPTSSARLLFALQALGSVLPVFTARINLGHVVEKASSRRQAEQHYSEEVFPSYHSVARPIPIRRKPTYTELFNAKNAQNLTFRIRSTPNTLNNYRYHLYTGGSKSRDLGELRRAGPAGPTRASLAFLSTSTGWKEMEVRRTLEADGAPSLQASPDMKHSDCPSVCEVCSSIDGSETINWKEREFKCRMPIPLTLTNYGRNGTCSSNGFPVAAKPCQSGEQCEGSFGGETCVTNRGLLTHSYGYCRCATQEQLEAHVRQVLRGYTCHHPRQSRKFLGFLSVRCYLPRYYTVRKEHDGGFSIYREVVLSEGEAARARGADGVDDELEEPPERHHDAVSLFRTDSQILENAIKHPFDPELEAMPIWRAECWNETSCSPVGIVRWGKPNLRKQYQQVLRQDMHLTVDCTKDVCRNDEVLPLLLLVVLGHVHASHLEVPDREQILTHSVQRGEAAKDPVGRRRRWRQMCGERPNGVADTGHPHPPHYDPLRLNESNFPQSIAPCITNIFHDRCKCDGADLTNHGYKQAWCFVEDCTDCADKYNDSSSCVPGKRPWARCWGDGYAPNRPINGICPTVHECTARPWRGLADFQMITLNKSIGRSIEGIMTRMYEPMLGQHKNRESTHRVTFTHCVPLGEYSRWLFTGLYVPGKDTVRFRHDIPLNEETVGFSTDIFYSTIGQDLHLKLDMQLYSAWDAGYIDGVIWFDMLQPFADREMFPMYLPFVSIQRRFKTCMADKLFALYPLMLKLCLAYTEDREIYLSMRATLFGVSLPFSREIHIGTVHVTSDEEGNGHFSGVTAGNFSIEPETVTYYMRETRERTTWDLTKMIVELERRSAEAKEKEKEMEARVEVLEQNVSRLLGKRWLRH